MHTITQDFYFDAGHRIWGHGGKCRHLHGHGYVAQVTLTPSDRSLDSLGFVLDFNQVKKEIGLWIEEFWDHNMLLSSHDPMYQLYQTADSHVSRGWDAFNGRQPYWFKDANPTAENIARELFLAAQVILHNLGVTVVSVTIHETKKCRATYTEGD